MEINSQVIIAAYINGQSLNSIARAYNTYPTTIKRILEKNNIELRHDNIKKGDLIVHEGEALIKWAKSQKRPVTKAELAKVLGKKRLSPSYFIKYPELGKYMVNREQKDTQIYAKQLYKWLSNNNISYKPNDRTKLGVSVDALLLEDYSGIAIEIQEKPKCVSAKNYEKSIKRKAERAEKAGVVIIFLNKKHFENLDTIKDLLDSSKTKEV